MADHSLQPVLSHYGLVAPPVQIEPLANAGGWSGSAIWRVTDTSGNRFCLRRWPTEHPTPDRLQFIHNVLLHVAPDLPVVACPMRTRSGATFIHHANYLWELTNWLQGVADFHNNPTAVRLRAAMHTLATYHNLAATFQTEIGIAPAVTDRFEQLQHLNRVALAEIENALSAPLDRELDTWASQLLAALKQRLNRTLPACPIAADSRLHLQPAIRDIHHDHILFTGDSITGLIDFGAMRIDAPLTDIARILGSLVADDSQARQTALNAYAELRPLSDTDRRLIDWLDHTGLILAALNWLRWLYVERRDMGPAAPIVRRIEAITRRLAIK